MNTLSNRKHLVTNGTKFLSRAALMSQTETFVRAIGMSVSLR
jgi:hypothetical protein